MTQLDRYIPWAATLLALLSVAFLIDFHAIDRLLLMEFGTPDGARDGSGIFFWLAWMFTALGSPRFVVPMSATLVAILLVRKELSRACFAFVALAGGAALAYVTKAAFAMAKPHHLPGSNEMAATSFPSGHAVLSLLLALTMVVLWEPRDPKLRRFMLAVVLAIVLAIGVSRVFLGTHWPSDILAGWLFAVIWISAAYRLAFGFGKAASRG
ncbi:phosphatase PAP2 family protein [Shinella sp.]|uniref:phosphatase PAP2 family protein n=1 Tax=Shinella sp. TaxID=1870904 RepID=UPI003F712BBD